MSTTSVCYPRDLRRCHGWTVDRLKAFHATHDGIAQVTTCCWPVVKLIINSILKVLSCNRCVLLSNSKYARVATVVDWKEALLLLVPDSNRLEPHILINGMLENSWVVIKVNSRPNDVCIFMCIQIIAQNRHGRVCWHDHASQRAINKCC